MVLRHTFRSLATWVTLRPSLITAWTALYLCLSRSSPSCAGVSGINRDAFVKHQPVQHNTMVLAQGVEP